MLQPLRGVHLPLPTPFSEGRVDLDRLGELIDRAADLCVDGIVVGGATGEAPALNDFELRSLLHQTAAMNRDRLNLTAAIGTASTRETVERALHAASCGFDSLLVVSPYFVRPGRRGLIAHHGAVAEATELPVALLVEPLRTGCDLEPEVVAGLAGRHENLVAVVETTGDPRRLEELQDSCDLELLCGVDATLPTYAAAGAVGALSQVAHLAPEHVQSILDQDATPQQVRELHAELAELLAALELDADPVALKAALAELGLCRDEVRSPLVRLDDPSREELRRLLRHSPALRSTARQPVGQE